MKKTLEVIPNLEGDLAVGWMRDDMSHVFHAFAMAAPGAAFQPSNGHGGPHWPCPVCDAHGYTEADFDEQMNKLMEDYSDHRPKA